MSKVQVKITVDEEISKEHHIELEKLARYTTRRARHVITELDDSNGQDGGPR